jgi:hypothetical protein
MEVLKGAQQVLCQVELLELELSLVSFYESSALLPEIWDHLRELHFRIVATEGICEDPRSGEMLQMDAIFTRYPG